MKHVGELRYVSIRTRDPEDWQVEICERAYLLWRGVWTEAFRELKVDIELASDDFLDRDMLALCHGNEPVGLMLERRFDISRQSNIEHNYFKNFPQEVIKKISSMGHRDIVAGTYLTVNPEWRRSRSGDPSSDRTDLPISELIVGLCVRRFMDSPATAQIGYSRNSHKVHEIRYRHGAVPLMRNVSAYNTPVDFMITTKATAKLSDMPGVAAMVERLYADPLHGQVTSVKGRKAA